jgi:hypothetical protein
MKTRTTKNATGTGGKDSERNLSQILGWGKRKEPSRRKRGLDSKTARIKY